MEQALAYDLFMDAYEDTSSFKLEDGVVVTFDEFSDWMIDQNVGVVNGQIKIEKSKGVNQNLEIRMFEIEGSGNQKIKMVKVQGKKSENEILDIKKDLTKGYMKLMSEFTY